MITSRSTADRTAIFDVPPTGDPMAPFDDPVGHLALMHYCSDFDLYTAAMPPVTVTVNHLAVAGYGPVTIPYIGTYLKAGQMQTTFHNLVAHGQPTKPRFMVLTGDERVPSGALVQRVGSRARFVSFDVTATHIRLKDVGCSAVDALPAMTQTYTVIVFRDQVENPSEPGFRAVPGRMVAGHGKLDTNQLILRRSIDGDSPFYIPRGPTSHLAGGAFRTVTPRGTVIEEAGYSGSFTGSPAVGVAF